MRKKIISAFLIVLMILPVIAFTGCVSEEGEGYITPTNTDPLFAFDENGKTLVREDEDPTKNTTFYLVDENSNYEFYFSEGILEFALVSKKTGDVWFSNPTPSERNNGIRSEMSSQITMFYLNKTDGSQKTLESYLDCVMNLDEESELKPYYVVNHDGHLRVIYILGQIKPDYIVPTCIDGETAEQYIETLKNTPGYLATSKYISSGSLYSKITPSTWASYPADRRDELKAIAPNIEDFINDGQTVYIMGDQTKWHNRQVMLQMQEGFTEVIGMTLEDRDAMNEKFGVETEAAKNFWIPLDYQLTETGLNVSIANDEIQYDKNTFAIASINLLQYFGSASRTESGYMFVPDGSGAIINFNNGKTNISDAVKVQLYGLDEGREREQRPFDNQNAYLPVFGIKKENSALFAIIESGDTGATITADIAGKSTKIIDRNRCYPSFKLCEYEELTFSSTQKTSRIYQNEMSSFDISVSYTLLEGDKANYSGMAEYYRNYLMEKNVLSQKDFSSVPFNIELVGAYDHKTAFLGVGYTEMKAITTFEQCREIIQKLSDAGIKNISVNYKGWCNNGIRNSVFNKIKVLNELGGKNGLSDLLAFADSLGVNLYFETELAYVYESEWFDGYSQLRDASRLVTRDIAYHYQYDVVSKLASEENFATIVSPSVIYNIDAEDNSKSNAVKVLDDLKKLGVRGVSLGSLSKDLTGNYKINDFYDRDKVAKTYTAVAQEYKNNFSVMGKGVNSYMLGYVENIFEISNTSSMFNLADYSVPFYQMVIHGCIQYSGEPINLNGDTRTVFLQAVEAGAGMYYRWCYEPNDQVQDLTFEGMYSLNYSSWLDEAIAMYKEYNELLASTAGEFITAHENVAENVNKVTYGNGVEVYVNYNSYEYTAADGTVVAAKSFARGGND